MGRFRLTFFFLAIFVSAGVSAQTEGGGQGALGVPHAVPPVAYSQPLLVDSMHLDAGVPFLKKQDAGMPDFMQNHGSTANYALSSSFGALPFALWDNAHLTVYGATDHLPGLLDTESGAVTLRQDVGRLSLSGSAMAHKYWMPMQGRLHTQYGFGGTLGYVLTDAVSLHVFGYYYAGRLLVSPALSPYVNTTSFGGYADLRLGSRFGADVGVRRYIDPMSGRWTTTPIVTPYVYVGAHSKTRIELPLGELLKAAIWGNRDNQMPFRPQPRPLPKAKKK